MTNNSLYTILTRTESSEFEGNAQRLKRAIEEIENAGGSVTIGNEHLEIDVPSIQKSSIAAYEENPVLKDAIDGKISVEGSLRELSEVNQGFKKYFPRRINKVHNERVEQIGELVGNCYSLKTRGILAPDNFAAGITFFSLCLCALIKAKNPETPVETLGQQTNQIREQVILPIMLTGVFGTALGVGFQGNRQQKLPFAEANYIDSKVEEFYR